MKKKSWKICAGWILGMAAIITLSEGCRNSAKMDESPKTQKQEKTEEKTKADLKTLQKVNRMDLIAEEYQTVKEETKIYSEDGSNILEENSGVRYYDTYEDEDVNLWEDSGGDRTVSMGEYSYRKSADGAVCVIIYPHKEQREELEAWMLTGDKKKGLFQISKEEKEEVLSNAYDQDDNIKVVTSIDLSKASEQEQREMGAENGEAEYEYIFEPESGMLQRVSVYYTPIDGEKILNAEKVYTYGEETKAAELLKEFESEEDREITCIIDPGTKEEEKYMAVVPAGIPVRIALNDGEKLWDDEDGKIAHESTDNEKDLKLYIMKE